MQRDNYRGGQQMEEKIKNIISEYERCEKLKNTEISINAALKIFAPFGLTKNYTERQPQNPGLPRSESRVLTISMRMQRN